MCFSVWMLSQAEPRQNDPWAVPEELGNAQQGTGAYQPCPTWAEFLRALHIETEDLSPTFLDS